jgi:UDP-N-acetylglucosamine--N-acetylmuramyl-(pentapeptide) pyrophosphoryl-undecaprenol N-acetylglucosamine transferase
MRILVSGGGTAGHISPILATLDALRSLDKEAEILYVGQNGSMESRIVKAAGLEFASIDAGKFRRFANRKLRHKLTDLSTIGLNLRDAVRVVKGVPQSIKIIKKFEPDIIFLKGGYVSLPVGLAASLLKVPYVVHESDVVPGLTNRILSKRALAVAVGFPPERYTGLPQEKLIHTGNPIRQGVLKAHRLEGVVRFKLNQKMPVVLITGGSQGSKTINDTVMDSLPELLRLCQVIHLTGERDIERVKFETSRMLLDHPERYQCFSFLMEDLGLALAASDLVVSRAGANTIAELAALKKPTILIPASHLRDQPTNALVLSRQGAVRVIQEERLNHRTLIREIEHVLGSEQEQRLLKEGIGKLAMPDAARKLAKLIVDCATGGVDAA